MDLLTILILLATFATIVSLASGVTSMAYGGEVAHRKSAEWMVWRVAFQALAFVLILFALSGWH